MNKEEFVSNVERCRPTLLYMARTMVRESDCEDAVQSAILSAWEHLPQLRDERAFDAWLRQILLNRCRQIQRGYKREKELHAALEKDEPEGDADDCGLGEALAKMGDEQRRLIELHHMQGYTLREMSAVMGKPEAVLKMRLSRARKRLRVFLLSLLLLILLAAAAVGTGMLDVDWFLKNRRAEPAAIENPITPETVDIEYSGELLEVTVSDAVWDQETLTLSFVYSIAGKDAQALTVHSGNIGVDGLRFDHIWTDEGIVPIRDWADGKPVHLFSVDGWRLGGVNLTGSTDYLPDGLGETFMAALFLDWLAPDRYESLLDEDDRLAFEAGILLKDYRTGELLEAQTMTIRIGAPTPQAWRKMYEAYDR